MAETSGSRETSESGRRAGDRSSLRQRARLVADLWKMWGVGVLFLAIAWMAYGMEGLVFVVEPFYLFFALLAFGYGLRRLREKLEQSHL
jgi:hypothetical protein